MRRGRAALKKASFSSSHSDSCSNTEPLAACHDQAPGNPLTVQASNAIDTRQWLSHPRGVPHSASPESAPYGHSGPPRTPPPCRRGGCSSRCWPPARGQSAPWAWWRGAIVQQQAPIRVGIGEGRVWMASALWVCTSLPSTPRMVRCPMCAGTCRGRATQGRLPAWR